MITNRFSGFAWGVLAYNIVVILWGAFVRATGSGAGCGSHWPLCNGELVPRTHQLETLIELSHRLTSGLALLAVVVLAIWAGRLYTRKHRIFKAALWSLFFILVEALIGAGLVLFEYVATNASVARAVWIASHLINTFFLLAALTLTAWWTSDETLYQWPRKGGTPWALLAAFVGMLILGASGGVTALGDTLLLHSGISPQESPLLAQLVTLRIYHPLLAFLVGGLVLCAVWAAMREHQTPIVTRHARFLILLFIIELVIGALNVAFKAPVWIQLVHLLMANLLWIEMILLTASVMSQKHSLYSKDSVRFQDVNRAIPVK